MSVRNSSNPPKAVERVYVGRGLDGLDDKIDLLESYFREMQKTTVETAYGPEDFLSFAGCAHYFGVIMIETLPAVPSESNQDDGTDEDAEGELEEETQSVSRATSPPSSIAHSPSNLSSPYITANFSESSGDDSLGSTSSMPSPRARSEQEQWENCFQADLQGLEVFPPEEDPNAPFNFRRREMPHRASGSLISDHSQASSPSISVDDCVNWSESDEEESTVPLIQQSSPKFYRAMNNPFRPALVDITGSNFGREHLESLQPNSPSHVETISPIDTAGPNLDALMHDAAIRLQNELRSNRIRAHESKTTPIPIGLIYLSASQNFLDPLHMGECSMGLYIDPAFRHKGAIINAINDVTEVAFNSHECHRLQSIVVDNEDKLPILELLASAGFRNEGVHRHAFYSNVTREWKDVTYFSMLATEWVYDNNNKNSQVRLRPKTLWDDMLSRHQRECEDLVRLEQKHENKLKRVASTETVRESLTGGDMAATSGKNIPGYSQQVLQKKRRIDSAQESKKTISSTASSISDSLSVPSIAVREQELVASTSRDMHSHSHSHEAVPSREACFSLRSLRPRKSSDSHLSSASESSFSNISAISSPGDWEILEDAPSLNP